MLVYLRWLLLPFSLLYGAVAWLRNRLFDVGLLRQHSLNVPTIVIGNLEVGGTGKTPMTEYLIRRFADRRLATLSRGYGRKTKGFLEVQTHSTAAEVGDEPLQFKQKFPGITVAVDADRVRGGRRLARNHGLILLDDAFQHRALRPDISILLFDYGRLSRAKWVLPAGDYRDCFMERRRADVIVVTKCPVDLDQRAKTRIENSLRSRTAKSDQLVLFSHTVYGKPVSLGNSGLAAQNQAVLPEKLLLVTGIARPAPLRDYLQQQGHQVTHLAFPDHHRFSLNDLNRIERQYQRLGARETAIVTTEKDGKRLLDPAFAQILRTLPVIYIPIELGFAEEDSIKFDTRLEALLAAGTVDRRWIDGG